MKAPTEAAPAPKKGLAGLRGEDLLAVAFSLVAAAVLWNAGVVARWAPWKSWFPSMDLEVYFYPKFFYGTARLARGEIPLWNPLEACGLPFLATAQVAALYPPKVLAFALFAAPTAMQVLYVSHLVLAGWLQYAYGRWLGCRPAAALVGAAMFASNWWFVHDSIYHPNRIMCLAWTPLVFFAWSRGLQRRTVGATALGGAALAMQLLAGYPGFTLLLGVLLGVATLVHMVRRAHRGQAWSGSIGAAVAMAAFGFAFAAPQLLPLREALAESDRVGFAARHAIVVPQAVGVAATLGASAAVLVGYLADRAEPTAAMALGGLLFGTGRARATTVAAFLAFCLLAGGGSALLAALPVFNALKDVWVLLNMIAPFFVATLAALGAHHYGSRRASFGRTPMALLGVPLLLGVGRFFAFHAPAELFAVLRTPRRLYAELADGTGARLGAVLAGAALVDRNRVWIRRAVPFVMAALVYAATLSALRAEREHRNPYPSATPEPALIAAAEAQPGGSRMFAPALSATGRLLISGVRDASGFEGSLPITRMNELLVAAGLGEGLAIYPRTNFRLDPAHRPLLDLLGISTIVTGQPLDLLPALRLRRAERRAAGLWDFRNDGALPRAFVVHRATVAATPEAALGTLLDPNFAPGDTAVLEAPAPELGAPTRPSRATIVVDRPEDVEIETDTDAAGLLVLTDTFYPGWTASLDDGPSIVLRADFAFRGVPLPAGRHRLAFRYRPASFEIGVVLALAASAIAIVGWARRARA